MLHGLLFQREHLRLHARTNPAALMTVTVFGDLGYFESYGH